MVRPVHLLLSSRRMNPATLIFALSATGFASGLRAFTPLAFVSWVAVWGWIPLGGSHLAFLGTDMGAAVVSFLAMGELIGDKLPMTPSRLTPGPLGARVLTGALAVTAVCLGLGQSWILGIICGGLSAIAGACFGFYGRRFLVTRCRLHDWIVALLEDLLTIALVLSALSLLF